MELQEYEAALVDLEVRVERLRILYEQWFQGLERLEPHVLRKEVDRRFYALQRETTRNTALKFRFQQLTQKYTTYVTYWTRVARQIEDGTYRRDVMKLRRMRQEYRDGLIGKKPELEIDVDVDSVEDSTASDLGAALAEFEAATSGPKAAAASPSPKSGLSAFSPQLKAAMAAKPGGADEEDEDTAVRKSLPPGAAERLTGNGVGTFLRPREDNGAFASFGKPKTVGGQPPAASGPAKPAAPSPLQAALQGAAAPQRVAAPTAATPQARPAPGPGAAPGGPPRAPGAPPAAPQRPAAPVAPQSASGAARPSPPAAPQPPRAAAAAPPPPTKPLPTRPMPTPGGSPAQPSAASARGRDFSDDQIRSVYDRYVEARRRNNERVDNVKFETVAKSIRDMVPKLQEKHAGKKIDFEVVVKDGKVGIKPVPK